jgi:pimeloyl-ACP methyl ester carboxylesterase
MQVVTTLVNSWYTPEFVRLHPDAVERRLSEIRSILPDAFTAAYELYVEADLAWWLPYLSVPTLIMTGEYARGCSADHARSAARTLTNGELVLLDGQRNGILTEVPDLVAGHLREFFTPITALARGALSAPAGSGRG